MIFFFSIEYDLTLQNYLNASPSNISFNNIITYFRYTINIFSNEAENKKKQPFVLSMNMQ